MAAIAASIGMRNRSLFTLSMLARAHAAERRCSHECEQGTQECVRHHSNGEHVERGLQLASGMLIAGAPRNFDAFFVKSARLFQVAQFLERLSAMKVGGGIRGVVFQ